MPQKTTDLQTLDERRMDTILVIHERLSPALESHPLIVRWKEQAREYERQTRQPCPPLTLTIRP